MGIAVELALLLSRAKNSRFLPNKSIGLNILAITSGVAFLAFALAIYDAYYSKVERIIFAITPHVMLRPSTDFGSDSSEGRDENAACQKVCRAPFSVSMAKLDQSKPRSQFPPDRVKVVEDWLTKNAPAGVSASRVLFEEAKLDIQFGGYSSGGVRPMRLLGLDAMRGNAPAPRVDLAFENAEVRARFDKHDGVLISDALASEILQGGGGQIIPGQSSIRLGQAGKMRDVLVIGIHRLGIHAISRNLIIAPYAIASELIGPAAANGPSYIGLTLAKPGDARALVNDMRQELRRAEITAIAWQSVTDLFDSLELYRWIIYVTLSLSIVVTAINTFVNVNILVMERSQHIGIIRAMGLPPSRLMAIFVAMGLFQSIVGTTLGYGLGIVIGYLLDEHINSMVRDFVPITDARISPDPMVYLSLLAFVAIVSMLTCLLAGRRALRSDIAQNLRSA